MIAFGLRLAVRFIICEMSVTPSTGDGRTADNQSPGLP